MKSIEYGVRKPMGDGFDRRPVKSLGSVGYKFGKLGKGGKPTYASKAGKGGGGANYAKQKKAQGLTGTSQGRGKNGFGKPPSSSKRRGK